MFFKDYVLYGLKEMKKSQYFIVIRGPKVQLWDDD